MNITLAIGLIFVALMCGILISFYPLQAFWRRKCNIIHTIEQNRWANDHSILLRFINNQERDKFLALVSSDWIDGVLKIDWASPAESREQVILAVIVEDTEIGTFVNSDLNDINDPIIERNVRAASGSN